MIPFVTFFSEAVIFALYAFVCLTLLKPRFSLGVRVLAYGLTLLCPCGAVAALTLAGNGMAALTLLPIIAYLPFSVCAFFLSEGDILVTAAACSVGTLASLTVKLLKKTMQQLLIPCLAPKTLDLIVELSLTVLAAGAAFFVLRYMRAPFGVCAGAKKSLPIIIPAAAVFLMIFINFNSASSVSVHIITLIIAVSFLALASRLFIYSAKEIEARENERVLSESLEIQRKSFERLSQNIDAGRIYRHDMRHHLKVLSGMAQQNNSVEIIEYIKELNENAELSATELFCKNPAVNAVLSEHISRARGMGCRTEYKILIPEELPFDLSDVCIILSNALENALNACERCPAEKRYIDLLVNFPDDRKLKISLRNSCAVNVEIGADGLPVTERRTDGHGIGLHGVKRTVEKYNGFICCSYENGDFLFCAEIFRDPNAVGQAVRKPERPRSSKALQSVVGLVICAFGLLNISPAAANALSEILSIEVRTISYGWGDNFFFADYPEFSGEGADALNQTTRDFIDEAKELFNEYTLRKYEGYAAEDAGYRIHRNDSAYLSAQFFATVNAGGSFDYSRCVTIDKKSGKELALSELFDEGYDYIGEISAEILRQMEFRVQHEKANYFIPGGIWSDEECFKEIAPDQEFYLDSLGNLFIVFEEYMVAPGSEGSPEFVMPQSIFSFDA